MPQVTASVVVPIDPATAFAVSQTTGDLRLRWDPFIREQHFLDGAALPGKGVRTMTKARVGPRMVSEYVSYRPPTNVGMTMVEGPWFFASFGGRSEERRVGRESVSTCCSCGSPDHYKKHQQII